MYCFSNNLTRLLNTYGLFSLNNVVVQGANISVGTREAFSTVHSSAKAEESTAPLNSIKLQELKDISSINISDKEHELFPGKLVEM